MIPEKKKLPSGVELELGLPDFDDAMALLETIFGELKAVNIDLTVDVNNLQETLAQEMPVGLVKDVVCQVIGSKAIKRDLRACMARCLYNGSAIDAKTFEPADARGDYFPAAWEVIRFSLLPFFKGLDWKSLIASAAKAGAGPR